uniref:Homeobox domain-containing protein n=1 Tax=Parascaris univalens TaxID=6257 RepID=A0A915AA62_PARUN
MSRSRKQSFLKHSIEDILNDHHHAEHFASDEEATGSTIRSRRNRTSFSPEQLEILEAAFNANTYPDQEFRERIAVATKLEESKIQV